MDQSTRGFQRLIVAVIAGILLWFNATNPIGVDSGSPSGGGGLGGESGFDFSTGNNDSWDSGGWNDDSGSDWSWDSGGDWDSGGGWDSGGDSGSWDSGGGDSGSW